MQQYGEILILNFVTKPMYGSILRFMPMSILSLYKVKHFPSFLRPNYRRFFTLSESSVHANLRDNPANTRPSCQLQCASGEKLWSSHGREGMKSNSDTRSSPVAIHAPSLDGSEPQDNYTEPSSRFVTMTTNSLVPPPQRWELTETKIKMSRQTTDS